ncbi:hypothetical protein GIB67_000454 [Kingdonia uniflora]|uniref:Protein kinase domain-containing protein n=1 Tax=Kingdonia uniflora TaxID=39325 RepID=A0A7J7L093_9MAGN|nr:hypothetical protein GIB67_000454 [Kingdonia uniflora]
MIRSNVSSPGYSLGVLAFLQRKLMRWLKARLCSSGMQSAVPTELSTHLAHLPTVVSEWLVFLSRSVEPLAILLVRRFPQLGQSAYSGLEAAFCEENLGLGGCIEHVWQDSIVYLDSDNPITIGRAYGRVSRHLLHEELLRRDLQSAAKDFLEKLGSGGFGTASKGTLPDSAAIAVKKLEENILLDAEYCPKVVDFGLAELVGWDFSRDLTTMRHNNLTDDEMESEAEQMTGGDQGIEDELHMNGDDQTIGGDQAEVVEVARDSNILTPSTEALP